MDIAKYIGVKIKFYKVPKECLIKTYLGSEIVIVSYGKYTSTTWDKHNTIKKTPNIYLEATTDEIETAYSRFCSFVDKSKPKKSKYACITDMPQYYTTIL